MASQKDLFHLPLVGTGETGNDQCGQIQYAYSCSEGHRILVPFNCGRASCPVCFHNWATRTTANIVPRLMALYTPIDTVQSSLTTTTFNDAKNPTVKLLTKLSRYPYRHIVISFPPDFECLNPFHQIKAMLKDIPLYGTIFYHPSRLTADSKEKIRNMRTMGLYDGGAWDIWHESGMYKDSSSVYFSPHVHMVVSGYIPEHLENLFHEKGFVLKIVRIVGNPDMSCEDNLFSLVNYLITHVGYAGRSKSYSYIQPSGMKLVKKEETIEQPLECPVCGNPMFYAFQDSEGEWIIDYSRPTFIMIKVISYTISVPTKDKKPLDLSWMKKRR